jgi:hypothetical protein
VPVGSLESVVIKELTRHRGVGEVIGQLILNRTKVPLHGTSLDWIPIWEAKIGLGPVMSHEEVAEVLSGLQGVYQLMGQRMDGAGLRLREYLDENGCFGCNDGWPRSVYWAWDRR